MYKTTNKRMEANNATKRGKKRKDIKNNKKGKENAMENDVNSNESIAYVRRLDRTAIEDMIMKHVPLDEIKRCFDANQINLTERHLKLQRGESIQRIIIDDNDPTFSDQVGHFAKIDMFICDMISTFLGFRTKLQLAVGK